MPALDSMTDGAISGVVLAGGTSKRMGRDKRFLEIDGVALLEQVLARLRPIATDLIVVTREPQSLPVPDARFVSDRYPGMGVLAGVHAGLESARYPWAFVAAGDMPFLSADLLSAMADLRKGADVDVVVPRWRGMFEPLHAFYRAVPCAEAAERALLCGKRRVVAFYPEVRVRVMQEEAVRRLDPDGASFFNINTPADWAAVRSRLSVPKAKERPEGLSH